MVANTAIAGDDGATVATTTRPTTGAFGDAYNGAAASGDAYSGAAASGDAYSGASSTFGGWDDDDPAAANTDSTDSGPNMTALGVEVLYSIDFTDVWETEQEYLLGTANTS
jgi:hypothetical protein